jgi:sugar O-acyltransferase (sialic acid O-acetyltransferase NeuD family)
MNKRIVIIGAGGHGKVVADIAKKNGYKEIAFLDDNSAVKTCGGYPVIGKTSEAQNIDADMIVGIGNAAIRRRMQESLDEDKIVTLIHPDAVVAYDALIGIGTVVMAGSVINPGAEIGKGCIINTCSSVDHDCIIGDYVHVSVGSHLCGAVTIEDEAWIGAGATISNNVSICRNSMIGAGAVVVGNIMETGTYIGIPARKKNVEQKIVVFGAQTTRNQKMEEVFMGNTDAELANDNQGKIAYGQTIGGGI